METRLSTLAAHFALLSLFAIGGANSVVPEMYRQSVEVAQWMSDRQFADLVAISQAAPGPNFIIVTLIGFHVAGLAGALVSSLAMVGPSCVAAYLVGRTWDRFKDAPWRIAIQNGLVPVSVGLVAATAFVLSRAADRTALAAAITLGTAALATFTRINPLWAFGTAAGLGLMGFV